MKRKNKIKSTVNDLDNTRLLVCAILTLAYSKGHVYYILLICRITLLFWNLLHSSM